MIPKSSGSWYEHLWERFEQLSPLDPPWSERPTKELEMMRELNYSATAIQFYFQYPERAVHDINDLLIEVIRLRKEIEQDGAL